MTHILSRDDGISISSPRVYRLMRSMTLPKPSSIKPKRTPQKDSGECHDLLCRQFHPSAPNLVWVSDFTYLRVNRTWYFLCIVMDLFSRKIIGWSLSSKHDTALIIAAFHKAYQSRHISYGLILHSDQGAEYTASSFRKLLEANNIVQSFSKKGCPFDNACCESFFKFLKKNCTNRRTYHSFEELRLDIFDSIENLYNNRLPHGSLAYKTPNEFEADFFNRFSSV